MRFIFRLIGIVISISLAVLLLALLINDTFTKTVFKTEAMAGSGIPIPRFLYNTNITNKKSELITFLPQDTLEKTKNDYLNSLKNCYGNYYYDEKNDITITKYQIKDNKYFRTVALEYDFLNYCADKYILSDTWLEDYKNIGKTFDLNITLGNLASLMNGLSLATRNIDANIDLNYKSNYIISYNYFLKNVHYYMEIKDISENDIIVKKTKYEETQFAVYTVDNALDFLKSYMS